MESADDQRGRDANGVRNVQVAASSAAMTASATAAPWKGGSCGIVEIMTHPVRSGISIMEFHKRSQRRLELPGWVPLKLRAPFPLLTKCTHTRQGVAA